MVVIPTTEKICPVILSAAKNPKTLRVAQGDSVENVSCYEYMDRVASIASTWSGRFYAILTNNDLFQWGEIERSPGYYYRYDPARVLYDVVYVTDTSSHTTAVLRLDGSVWVQDGGFVFEWLAGNAVYVFATGQDVF